MIPPLLSQPPQKAASVSAPKKRKHAILYLDALDQLQVLTKDTASPENESWEQFLLPNSHTDRLKFYNSVVRWIYESAICSKQAGFKQ